MEGAFEAEGKQVPQDIEERIRKAWELRKAAKENAEKKTAGRWFKDLSKELMDDEASKVALARYYTEMCRDLAQPNPSREKVGEAKTLCQDISQKLSLPPTRAVKTVEPAKQ